MKRQKHNPRKGFTLLELIVSMALGLIVMAAMASLFRTGLQSTLLVTQRSQAQQDMRAAIDLMVKDISMAGAGLPSGGIQLPTGTGSTAVKYACDQSGACHVTNHTYTGNYMYGIIPGYSNGVEASASIPADPSPAINDSITSIYCDYNFPLFEYNVTFTSATQVSMTVAPAYTTNPPPAVNAAGGIVAGDLIYLSNSAGNAVAEVTNSTTTGLTFAAADALNFNQTGAATNNVNAITGGANTVAYRLYVVTYYLTVPGGLQTPRLMRQVNGLTPVPVADNIINLQFAYDVYNTTTSALDANQANPLGVGESMNNTQKVNIVVMGQSIVKNSKNTQNMYLATSVSARNMAFRNRYQ